MHLARKKDSLLLLMFLARGDKRKAVRTDQKTGGPADLPFLVVSCICADLLAFRR